MTTPVMSKAKRRPNDTGGKPAGRVTSSGHKPEPWEKLINALVTSCGPNGRNLMRVDEFRRPPAELLPDQTELGVSGGPEVHDVHRSIGGYRHAGLVPIVDRLPCPHAGRAGAGTAIRARVATGTAAAGRHHQRQKKDRTQSLPHRSHYRLSPPPPGGRRGRPSYGVIWIEIRSTTPGTCRC